MGSKVKIMSASYNIVLKRSGLKEHHHLYYQLYYIIDGYPTFIVGKDEIKACPGSLFYIPPYVSHHMLPTSNITVNCYEFKVRIEDDYIANNLKKTLSLIKGDQFTKTIVEHIFNNWYYTDQHSIENCEAIMEVLLLGFFVKDLHYSREKVKTNRISSEGYNDITKRIMSYIDTNHQNPFSLEEMSRELNYNSSYLSYAFSKNAGMSIIDFLNLYRTRMAVSSLCFFSRDVLTTCEISGFSNRAHFSRTFKKYTGTTPQNFKTVFSSDARNDLQYLFTQEPILNASVCTIEEALASLKSVGNVVKEIQINKKNKKHL